MGAKGWPLVKIAKAFRPHISTSEPDIDIFSSRIGIFYSPFLHRNLVHLWRNTHKCRILQDIYFLYLIRRFVSGLIEYTCINTRKLKGFERNYIIAKEQKSDEHGASFQSSPKINRMHDHHETYFHLIKIFRFFDHWSIHLFKSNQLFQAIDSWTDPFRKSSTSFALIFPKLSSQNLLGALNMSSVTSRFLSPVSTVSVRNARDHDPFWRARTKEKRKKKKTLAFLESHV